MAENVYCLIASVVLLLGHFDLLNSSLTLPPTAKTQKVKIYQDGPYLGNL
jgi:hypothetical protein